MTGRFAGVVIVAAGRGERFGDRGKVLAEAAGRPLLAWSLDAAMAATTTAEIVVVCGEHTRAGIEHLVASTPVTMSVRVCGGGAERQASVGAGIDQLSGDVEVAVIHDAARPLASAAMFDDVAIAAREIGGAILAAPVTDTIKQVDGDHIVRTIPRETLRAAQTPQAFRRDVLAGAMAKAADVGRTFTDEAALLEWVGLPVLVRPGSATNLKVTVPEDLLLVEALLHARSKGSDDVSA